MGFAQILKVQGHGKSARIPDLQPVGEEHDLYAAVVRVVTMRDGVHDGLGNDFLWNLIGNGSLHALRARTH